MKEKTSTPKGPNGLVVVALIAGWIVLSLKSAEACSSSDRLRCVTHMVKPRQYSSAR